MKIIIPTEVGHSCASINLTLMLIPEAQSFHGPEGDETPK